MAAVLLRNIFTFHMSRHILLLLLYLLPAARSGAQSTADPQQAFREAERSGKPVLLVFQGSDWCLPCIRLEKKVLSTEQFLQFATGHIVLLKADFPQKQKNAPELQQQYDTLAAQYDPEGSFPKLVLLDARGKILHSFRTDYTAPEALISDIEKELPVHERR